MMIVPLLEACGRRPLPRPPVWFMRQAGRYMPEYRRIRADHSILEICKNPELAAQVTLQPIDVLDVDAAIIFADLLLPLETMGLKLEFVSGDGPVIHNPVRSPEDVEKLDTHHSSDLLVSPISVLLHRALGWLASGGARNSATSLALHADNLLQRV
jgi:uroporphyrinogen decarboxylase